MTPASLPLAFLSVLGAAASGDPVFDLTSILSTPLNPNVLSRTTRDGVVTEEVQFHSEVVGETRVEIFGYFSYPAGARQLPAYIWNQGGLSRATPVWTESGAKRGYAVLCIDFPLPGYRSTGAFPITSALELPDDPTNAPIYHGAVALLKAVSFLTERPEVDADRIGMAGSSWGGFFTTLMVGIDHRIKVGASLFGTGRLDLGNPWWDTRQRPARVGFSLRERWRRTLDPAFRLERSPTPIAWFTGTNDSFYWLRSVNETYLAAAGPKQLSLVPNADHELPEAVTEQAFAWLDAHLKRTRPIVEVTPLTILEAEESYLVRWSFSPAMPTSRCELMTAQLRDESWRDLEWTTRSTHPQGDRCEMGLARPVTNLLVGGAILDGSGSRYSTPVALLSP